MCWIFSSLPVLRGELLGPNPIWSSARGLKKRNQGPLISNFRDRTSARPSISFISDQERQDRSRRTMARLIGLLASCLLVLSLAQGQPFNTTAAPFQPDISEPVARNQSGYTGFVFSFNNVRYHDQAKEYLAGAACLTCLVTYLRRLQTDLEFYFPGLYEQ